MKMFRDDSDFLNGWKKKYPKSMKVRNIAPPIMDMEVVSWQPPYIVCKKDKFEYLFKEDEIEKI